jgi:hypothetical protein
MTSPEDSIVRVQSLGKIVNSLLRNGWFGLILAAVAILWLTLNPKFLGFGLGFGAIIASLKRDRFLNVSAYLAITVLYLALQDTGVFGSQRHAGSLIDFMIGGLLLGCVIFRARKMVG